MKYIIDSSSLINLERFYSGLVDGKGLKEFIQRKIASGEIVVIDKVLGEIYTKETLEYLGKIKTVPTNYLIDEFFRKEKNWYVKENEGLIYKNNQGRISAEKDRFKKRYADLWLVLYSLYLQKKGEEVMLITGENSNEKRNGKLYLKIPTICDLENIQYGSISDLLFNKYSHEIKISFSKI